MRMINRQKNEIIEVMKMPKRKGLNKGMVWTKVVCSINGAKGNIIIYSKKYLHEKYKAVK
jgi:hypothetical protein